jgi:hypothetical protein
MFLASSASYFAYDSATSLDVYAREPCNPLAGNCKGNASDFRGSLSAFISVASISIRVAER